MSRHGLRGVVMAKRRVMNLEERGRLDRLCYKAKLGTLESTKEIMQFLSKMWKLDPDGYQEVSAAARKRAMDDYAAPFKAIQYGPEKPPKDKGGE